ncbi:MAG: DUF2937 family protein [Pseudomonadota bacterium]|nr:DUF2937 family protein [Pseudomonadota bacterium]
MIGRFLAVVLGLAGAGLGSQAPGFTLQYMQNLAGRVDELKPIVEQFDADVGRYGYTRESALAECASATGLLDALCGGYATTIERYEILLAHLGELKAAGPYVRPLLVARGAADNPVIRDIAESVATEFRPAVPATLDGAAYAGGGFAVIWGALSFVFGLLGAMTGGGRRYA